MPAKTAKTRDALGPARRRAATAALPVEDDERYLAEVNDYITRNRESLNESIRRSRKELAEGKYSKQSIEEIIAKGHRRHGRNT
jgi:hypothetical protein